jgi:hypothetical protein
VYAAFSTVVPSDYYEMWYERYTPCRPISFLSYSHIEHCVGVNSTYRILMVLGSNIGPLCPPIQLFSLLPDKCRDNTLN